ncbi:MAG: SDR family NAD(P)-dependent oxidoreductase [Halioglobus sp.]
MNTKKIARWNVRTAVISGAASGIGQAAIKALVADGSNVVAIDLKIPAATLEEFTILKTRQDQKIITLEADVTNAEGLREAVSSAVMEIGEPDFALNCAGIQRAGNFERISDADYAAVINVNLLGSRNFARAVLPHMHAASQLALLASMGGLIGNYGYSAYAASKFGVVGLAEVLRLEYKPLDIGVSVICPPEIPTAMVEEEMKTMHPVARQLKDSGGLVQLEELIPYMLNESILKKKYMVIPGRQARILRVALKLIPTGILNMYTDSVVRKVFKREPGAPKR